MMTNEEAIKILKSKIDGSVDTSYEWAETVRLAIKALKQLKWIPCSERLPEDGRQVLVYARSVHYALAKYDEMRNADGIYSMQWVTFDAWKPFYTIKNVIAWMPLPEPFREEGEQDD